MNFWDSSAIVPLVIEQEQSEKVEAWYKNDKGAIYVWWSTITECISALSRLERLEEISSNEAEVALRSLRRLARPWNVVLPSEQLKEKANRLLRVHPLKAADSFQLASAIVAAEDFLSVISFVTLDERLASAARKEGFQVLYE